MNSFFKQNTFSIVYAFFLGVMPLVVSSSITVWVMFHEANIHQFDLPTWTMVYAAASLTMAFALTPTTFVALLSGYFLGWEAMIPVCASYWLASWIGYVMAAKIDGGRLLNALEERKGVKELLQNLQKQEFKIILLARLSPVLPFAVSNLLFSCSGAKLKNFLTAGFIGMLPRTLLSIWVGTQAKEIKALVEHPSEGAIAQVAIILMIGVSLYGLFRVVRKAIGE